MLTQTKIQIEKDDYDFIKKACKKLQYRSLSEYMREAVQAKVKADRKRLREMKRKAAMEMIGEGKYEGLFEPLGGEDFEDR
jgi:Arc/MetJ-type ribon-helix-helix transcriptional regulator